MVDKLTNNISMNTTPDLNPEEITERHRSLLRLLVEALRHGTRHAQAYADWQDEEIDTMLSPALVRKGAKRFLRKQATPGLDVADEEVEFKAEYLPNLGLSVTASNGDRIRILKSDHESLPIPGPSVKRQEFYAQQLLLFPASDYAEEAKPSRANLVLHWVADDEYHLKRAYLACPKAGGLTRASVKAHFDDIIWQRKSIETSPTQAEAPVDDLDIFFGAREKTGTGDEE